jgi:hypothetical protein
LYLHVCGGEASLAPIRRKKCQQKIKQQQQIGTPEALKAVEEWEKNK